jgi:hypothetical protein
MKSVFADTFYFLALLNERDAAHKRAVAASPTSPVPKSMSVWRTTRIIVGRLTCWWPARWLHPRREVPGCEQRRREDAKKELGNGGCWGGFGITCQVKASDFGEMAGMALSSSLRAFMSSLFNCGIRVDPNL